MSKEGWSEADHRNWRLRVQSGEHGDDAEESINANRATAALLAALDESTESPSLTATLAQRGNRYGAFEGHAKITQALKKTMRDFDPAKWEALSDDAKEALEMVAHKVGRILNGDPLYADSWVDTAGYAQLVATRYQADFPEHQ